MSYGFLWLLAGILMLGAIVAVLGTPKTMKLSSRTGDADPPENVPEWDPGAADEHLPLNMLPDMQPRKEIGDAVDEHKP